MKLWQEGQQKISWAELSRRLPLLKLKEETVWLSEINAQSLCHQIINLEKAYQAFFKQGAGFPKFKNRRGRQSFSFPQGFRIEGSRFKMPKFDWMTFANSRSFEGAVKRVTISRDPSGKHFMSVTVETGEDPKTPAAVASVTGIDLGIKHFATLSTGEKIDNPRLLSASLRRLQREQRRLSRKQKGSSNRNKQRIRVALAHEKVRNQRSDFLHKLSTRLIRENQAIGVEDLGVRAMIRNRSLSRAISDASWSEFLRQLKYKAEWHGSTLITIGRFDPSSRLCICGVINQSLQLSDRTWTCASCGASHDRDVLAANNIARFAIGRVTPESTPVESRRTKGTRRSRKRLQAS